MSVFEVILARIRENMDQKKSEYGHFLRSDKNKDKDTRHDEDKRHRQWMC